MVDCVNIYGSQIPKLLGDIFGSRKLNTVLQNIYVVIDWCLEETQIAGILTITVLLSEYLVHSELRSDQQYYLKTIKQKNPVEGRPELRRN